MASSLGCNAFQLRAVQHLSRSECVSLGNNLSVIGLPCHSRNFLTVASRNCSRVSASAESSVQEAVQSKASENESLKKFLSAVQKLGRVRIIVNTGMGVLESVTTLEGLFYQAYGNKGEFANVMKQDDNVDFHLLLSKVASAKIQKGVSQFNGQTTYMIRLVDEKGETGASLLLMWKPGKPGDFDEGQVESFEALLAEYGEETSFV